MPIICPTVLAHNNQSFREQIERIAPFAERIQIDLTDGLFAKPETIALQHVWWPHTVQADLHLMYERPDLFLEQVIALSPSLVICHAEAQGEFGAFATRLKQAEIKVGVAILEPTPVSLIVKSLDSIDHVLIFSGDLGHYGGHANLELLAKVKELKNIKPTLEIGWDGGVNDHNAKELLAGGVDVLNVGGFIQKAADPKLAYDKLNAALGTQE